jgi:hypothetical protein
MYESVCFWEARLLGPTMTQVASLFVKHCECDVFFLILQLKFRLIVFKCGLYCFTI